MATSFLARRVRHARPEARVRRLVLSEADYALFAAIERHGPLPSSYLYEFTQHLRRDRTHLQNRLTEFYNGDDRGSCLTRPPQQFAAYEARYQHLVYDLAPRARRALAERDGQTLFSLPRADPFVHRLMTSCVSASFELAAKSRGLGFIPLHSILDRHPEAPARRAPNALALPAAVAGQPAVIPDLLFGLEYPGAGFRFFAVECDRNTESIDRKNLRQSAFARKLTGYAAALDRGTYRAWWGVPNLHVLVVTTSAAHAANILTAMRNQVAPPYHPYFGIVATPTFGASWRVPKEPLSFLVDHPWQTPDGWKDIARP